MSATAAAKLYTPSILGLAVELADFKFCPEANRQSEVRSRSCGSKLSLSLELNGLEQIAVVGLKVSACAIGQAAAAIFAKSAVDRNLSQIEDTYSAIQSWLSNGGAAPDWPELALLKAASAFPGRHEAILLPWRAASLALSNSHLPD